MARRPQSLTGRPRHRAPAKNVQVQVADGLATISTLVHHHAIATVLEPEVTRNLCGHRQEVTCQWRVCLVDLGDPANVAHRDDQDVRRRLRGEVMKGDHMVVAVNDLCGNVAGSDPAENALRHNNASAIKTVRLERLGPPSPNGLRNRDDCSSFTPQDTRAKGGRRCPNGTQRNSFFH